MSTHTFAMTAFVVGSPLRAFMSKDAADAFCAECKSHVSKNGPHGIAQRIVGTWTLRTRAILVLQFAMSR